MTQDLCTLLYTQAHYMIISLCSHVAHNRVQYNYGLEFCATAVNLDLLGYYVNNCMHIYLSIAAIFEQDENAKRAKLISLNDTKVSYSLHVHV